MSTQDASPSARPPCPPCSSPAVPYIKDAKMHTEAVVEMINKCMGDTRDTSDDELRACPGKIRAAMDCQYLADVTIQSNDTLQATVSNMCNAIREMKGKAGDLSWAPKAVGMYVSLLMKGLDLLGCDGLCPGEPTVNEQSIEVKRLALREAVASAMGIDIYCPNCKSKPDLSASGKSAGGGTRVKAALSCLKKHHMTPPAALTTEDTTRHQSFTACYDSIMALTCDDMQELKTILKSGYSVDLCKVVAQGLDKITVRQISIYGSQLAMVVRMFELVQCPAVARHAAFSSGCPGLGESVAFYNALKKAVAKNMRLVCDPCSACDKKKQGLPMWTKAVLLVAVIMILVLISLTIYFATRKSGH